MHLKINTDKLKHRFKAQDVRLITERFGDDVERANRFLHLPHLPADFIIDPHQAHSPWAAAAYVPGPAFGPERIFVQLHPSNLQLWKSDLGQTQFSSVISHELMHIKRQHAHGRKANLTLGDVLVEEGFALNFELQAGHPLLNAAGQPFRSDHISIAGQDVEIAKHALAFRLSFNGGFQNTEGDTVNINEYAFGRALVGGWLAYSGLAPSKATGVSADAVLQSWKEGKYDIGVYRPSAQSSFKPLRLKV